MTHPSINTCTVDEFLATIAEIQKGRGRLMALLHYGDVPTICTILSLATDPEVTIRPLPEDPKKSLWEPRMTWRVRSFLGDLSGEKEVPEALRRLQAGEKMIECIEQPEGNLLRGVSLRELLDFLRSRPGQLLEMR